MRVLGVNCNPHAAFLAVVDGGSVVDEVPERMQPPGGIELGERLLEFISDVRRAIGRLEPKRVALLMPEAKQRGGSHHQLMPRIVLETLVRVAAAQEAVPLELVSRPTVRSRLGLPRKGSLDSHLAAAGGAPVGHYWNEGRGLAALAALALETT